jgi:hypothetical protein
MHSCGFRNQLRNGVKVQKNAVKEGGEDEGEGRKRRHGEIQDGRGNQTLF